MLLRKSLFVPLAFVIVLSGKAFSDPVAKDHGHKTPHGGLVQEAEGMHAEFLIDKSGQPKLYLYDKGMKSLDRSDFQMKLTVKGHDGAQHTRELKAFKEPKDGTVYKGDPITGLKDWDTAVVSVKIKDRWSHLRFSHH